MADPVGLVGSSFPTPGVVEGKLPAGGPKPDPDSASFRDLLMENLARVNQLQQDATTAIEDLASGERNDLEQVLMATQKADTAFRMLLSVRNKLMEAYRELESIRV